MELIAVAIISLFWYDAGYTQGFNDAIDEMQKAKVKKE
jgi:hypothetical protein